MGAKRPETLVSKHLQENLISWINKLFSSGIFFGSNSRKHALFSSQMIIFFKCFYKSNLFRTGEIGTNGKPSVACEVCGKKLADPSSLYRHRKIHSGDKPHKCPYCPR